MNLWVLFGDIFLLLKFYLYHIATCWTQVWIHSGLVCVLGWGNTLSVVTCSAPSHFLNQHLLIANLIIENKSQLNYTPNTNIFPQRQCIFWKCCLQSGSHFFQSSIKISRYGHFYSLLPWWGHQMETSFASLAICAGNSPVNSPHKGQWRGTLMLSLICALTNGWVNNGEAGDLRRHCAHYDVLVLTLRIPKKVVTWNWLLMNKHTMWF